MYMEVVDGFTMDEVPFETYKDLDKSQLHGYVRELPIIDELKDTSGNEVVRNITRKMHVMESRVECFKKLSSSKNVTRVVFSNVAELAVDLMNQKYGKRVMKKAEPPLLTGYKLYKFEDASPYVDKFLDYQHRIRESGIDQVLPMMMKKPYQVLYEVYGESHDVDNLNIRQLMIVILAGYFVALSVFMMKMLISCFLFGTVSYTILQNILNNLFF